MIIIAPIERYTPFDVLSSCLSERNSFLRLFFSAELRLDLSIDLISSILEIILATSGETGVPGATAPGTSIGAATDALGINVNDRLAAIK